MLDRIAFTLALACALVAGQRTSSAEVITIDFNSLGIHATNSQVQSYIRDFVPNTNVSGAHGGENYDGEGYVVGFAGGQVRALTLGNTEHGVWQGGALDNFIVNMGSDRIVMTFDRPVYSVSFDFEIFPNGHVADGTRPGAVFPDFTLRALSGGNEIFEQTILSVMPGTNGTWPNSPNNSPELAPQLLSAMGPIHFAGGATRLEFIDWPERIGIDNLVLDFGPPTVAHMPEPASVVLCGAMVLLVGARMWRRHSRNAGSNRL